MFGSESIPLAVVLLSGVIAGVTDIWKFKVYNALTLPLLVLGLAYHAIVLGTPGLLFSCGGAALGFGLLFIPYLLGGVGGGDVKLLAGIGAWLGPEVTLFVVLLSAIAAGVYALVLLAVAGGLRETVGRLRIFLFQTKAILRHLAPDEQVEVVATQENRRLRLIPFAAMVPVGIITLLVWAILSTSSPAEKSPSARPMSDSNQQVLDSRASLHPTHRESAVVPSRARRITHSFFVKERLS